jgi:hypothetical protein
MIRFALVIALVAFGTALADQGVSPRDADARPSGPSAPYIVDQMGGGSLRAIAVRGDTLFVGAGPRVVAYDQSAFAESGRLVRLGASEVLTGSVQHLAVVDDRLLALQFGVGLAILDTADPRAIRTSAVLPMPGVGTSSPVNRGRHAYVASCLYGVSVVDLDAAGSPLVVANVPLAVPDRPQSGACATLGPWGRHTCMCSSMRPDRSAASATSRSST